MSPLKLISLIEILKGFAGLGVSLILYEDSFPISLSPWLFHHLKALNPHTLFLLTGLAALFTMVRFFEAYGLWFQKSWGFTLGLVSTVIYLPFEVYELMTGPTLMKSGVIIVNLAVLVYLAKRKAIVRMGKLQGSPGQR